MKLLTRKQYILRLTQDLLNSCYWAASPDSATRFEKYFQQRYNEPKLRVMYDGFILVAKFDE